MHIQLKLFDLYVRRSITSTCVIQHSKNLRNLSTINKELRNMIRSFADNMKSAEEENSKMNGFQNFEGNHCMPDFVLSSLHALIHLNLIIICVVSASFITIL